MCHSREIRRIYARIAAHSHRGQRQDHSNRDAVTAKFNDGSNILFIYTARVPANVRSRVELFSSESATYAYLRLPTSERKVTHLRPFACNTVHRKVEAARNRYRGYPRPDTAQT